MLTKGWLSDKTISLQLLILALLWLCILSVSLFFSHLILHFLGYDTLSDPSSVLDYTNPENIPIMKFLQVVYSISAFFIPPLVFGYLINGKPLEYLNLVTKPKGTILLLTALTVVSLLPAINTMGELNSRMDLPDFIAGEFSFEIADKKYHFEGIEQWMQESEKAAGELTEVLLDMPNLGSLLFVLFMVAFLPAIGEELLFRGALQKVFINKTRNIHIGIWLAAFIFSAIHLQFYTFLPRMVLGALFGYLLVWSGNIWYPIMGHFMNNGSAVLLSYLVQQGVVSKEFEDVGSGNNMYLWGVTSLVVGGILVYSFYKKERPHLKNSAL